MWIISEEEIEERRIACEYLYYNHWKAKRKIVKTRYSRIFKAFIKLCKSRNY